MFSSTIIDYGWTVPVLHILENEIFLCLTTLNINVVH